MRSTTHVPALMRARWFGISLIAASCGAEGRSQTQLGVDGGARPRDVGSLDGANLVAPEDVDFGRVAVHPGAVMQRATLVNEGSLPARLTSITVQAPFFVSLDRDGAPLPATLPVVLGGRGRLTLWVGYEPPAAGADDGVVAIEVSEGDGVTFRVRGLATTDVRCAECAFGSPRAMCADERAQRVERVVATSCPGRSELCVLEVETVVCETRCNAELGACARCGDGIIDGDEACDGASLADRTCVTEVNLQQGELRCTDACVVDTSACFECGNGVREGPEVCDGEDFGEATCVTEARRESGTLRCSGECSEIDASPCFTCGDSRIEGPEICDSIDFDRRTCESMTGLSQGSLHCDRESCQSIDVSGCYECGNGTVEGLEVCDGESLNGETCETVSPYIQGELTCAIRCSSFVTDGCFTCGNGRIEGPETCDGPLLGGQSCETLGFIGGELACGLDECQLDTSDCAACGDGICEVQKGERADTCPADCEWTDLIPGRAYGLDVPGRPHLLVGRRADGTMWGYAPNSQMLGRSSTVTCSFTDPCRLTSGSTVALDTIIAGYRQGAGVGADGRLYGFGHRMWSDFVAGAPTTTATVAPPEPVAGLPDVLDAKLDLTSCAVQNSGDIWCWGRGQRGNLGHGVFTSSVSAPVQVSDIDDAFQVEVGASASCARTSTVGQVECWGSGANGVLAQGEPWRHSAVPVQVPGLTHVIDIAVGGSHACALLDTGDVRCWGNGTRGEVGHGVFERTFDVEVVSGISNIVDIAAGYLSTCAVEDTGAVWCWGDGPSLGRGQFQANSATPLRVQGINDAVRVESSSRSSAYCAQRTNDEWWCWGRGNPLSYTPTRYSR